MTPKAVSLEHAMSDADVLHVPHSLPSRLPRYLEATGTAILRYGLVALLLLFGLMKWTRAEADGIQPWVSHSPFMSWLYLVTTVQGASIAIGVIELVIAAMIAARRLAPRVAAVGSALGIGMFSRDPQLSLHDAEPRFRQPGVPHERHLPARGGGLEHGRIARCARDRASIVKSARQGTRPATLPSQPPA